MAEKSESIPYSRRSEALMGSALNRNLGDCEPRSAQPKRLEFPSHCPGHAVRGNDPKPSFAIHRTFDHTTAFSALLEMKVYVRAFQKTRGGL
jgi:hypothetical protein